MSYLLPILCTLLPCAALERKRAAASQQSKSDAWDALQRSKLENTSLQQQLDEVRKKAREQDLEAALMRQQTHRSYELQRQLDGGREEQRRLRAELEDAKQAARVVAQDVVRQRAPLAALVNEQVSF